MTLPKEGASSDRTATTTTTDPQNTNIWNKRLNWVKLRDASKNKYERLHWNLKIAYYDYEVTRRYGNKEGKKKALNRIASLKRNVEYNTLDSELRAIKKALRNSKMQIEYDKEDLRYTYSEEERNGKKYIYKQKRIGSRKEHEYVAKDWKDFEIKQYQQAQNQVWNDHWALKDLAPVEIETFNMISNEVKEREETWRFINRYLKTKKDRNEYFDRNVSMEQVKAHFHVKADPILEKAAEQLGMYHYRHYRVMPKRGRNLERIKERFNLVYIKDLPEQEIKNILRATRKALIRRGNIDKKLESIAMVIGEGEDTIENVKRFIVYLMNQIGFYHKTDQHAELALIRYINSSIAKNPKSMYAELKPVEVKEFAENAVRRFKAMGGNFQYS